MSKKKSDFNFEFAKNDGLTIDESKIISKYWEFNNRKFIHSLQDVVSHGIMNEKTILENSIMFLNFNCMKCNTNYSLIAINRKQFLQMASNKDRLCYTCLLEIINSSKVMQTEYFKKPSKKHSKIRIETKDISFNSSSKISIDISDIILYKLVK